MLILASLLPIKNNYHLLVVKSGSMEPGIKTGSLVLTLPQDDYKINDIISYTFTPNKNKQFLVTHRIIEINRSTGQNLFITKGDANNAPDSNLITQNQIIGKLIFKISYIGYPINYLQTSAGAIIVIIFASIIIYREILKIQREFINLKKQKINSRISKLSDMPVTSSKTIIKEKSSKNLNLKSKNKLQRKKKPKTNKLSKNA